MRTIKNQYLYLKKKLSLTVQAEVSLRNLLRWYVKALMLFTILSLLLIFLVKTFASPITYSETLVLLSYLTDKNFIIYLFVGFLAQLIDGSLGMAYGVSSTSFLMSTGVSPIVASTSVHVAEVFTTGASGLSHWRFGNVNKKLFIKLAIPGAIGAALGAYVLTAFDGNVIKPYVSAYLLIMGIVIIVKAFKISIEYKERKKVSALALFGGFVDASGGGGWGPVVTSTLIGSGHHPKKTIGTVNASEFFVALAASGIFTLFIGINSWLVISGLIAGGVFAAPIGAYICNRINVRGSMIAVGLLIIFLSLRTILKFFKII